MLSQSLRNLHTYSDAGVKERQRNYGIHMRKIEEIINKESKIKEMKQQHNKIVEVLQRSKDIARKFKLQEDIRHRINENTKMLCALIDIKRKPRMLTEWKKMEDEIELRKSRSRTPKKERQEELMKNSNFKLVESLLHQSASVRKYKKKVKGEIAEYLKRRNHLQKVKPIDNFPLPATKKRPNASTRRLKTLDPSYPPSSKRELMEIPEDSFQSALQK